MIRALALLLSILSGTPALADSPFPLVAGGPYALTDQRGQIRTQVDPQGHAQLLFFGYANCPGICSAAMPLMADVVDAMAARGVPVSPVMITVDPARDTVAAMAEPLAKLHPDFVGLTGDADALAASYAAFNVDHRHIYDDPEYGPVYSHGSLIYLMDGAGAVLTVMPPVLDPARAADIAWTYLSPRD